MLTFPEKVVLYLLDDEEGVFLPIGKNTLELALTGSVLMELAFADRLDTDLERVMTVDRAPIGDSLLVGRRRRAFGGICAAFFRITVPERGVPSHLQRANG